MSATCMNEPPAVVIKAPKTKMAYILIDYKMFAVIGVFSSIEKVEETKTNLYKRDLKVIKDKLNESLVLDNLNEDQILKVNGTLTQINFVLNDYDSRATQIPITYNDYCYSSRYAWYSMPLDDYDMNKSFSNQCILLPYNKLD